MPLVPLPDLLAHAMTRGYAVGYFEAWDSYSMEAVLEAAVSERAPVILGFGAMMLDANWLDSGGVELLGAIGAAYAARSTVPAALILNETHTLNQAVRGVTAGFNTVMIDTHTWDQADAVTAIRQLVDVAHANGVSVEAELGSLPDFVGGSVDDSHASKTDPREAARFVAATGVDCLAVSFGNVHLLSEGWADVDLAHLSAIRDEVTVPLVVHGGTSFPPHLVADAVHLGAVKFNVGTALKRAFAEALQGEVGTWAPDVDVHAAVGSHKRSDAMVVAKSAVTETARKLMRAYGSSGQADAWQLSAQGAGAAR